MGKFYKKLRALPQSKNDFIPKELAFSLSTLVDARLSKKKQTVTKD